MSPDRAPKTLETKTLLKGGAALGAVGVSLVDASAAEAGNKALKAQAEALKAAAAARPELNQPAATATGDHYARAKVLLAGGDVPGAMAAFRRVLAMEPQSVDAMNGLGVTYDRMGRHDVARGWYEAALAVSPNDGAVLANLGYSLTLQEEWRAAIPWLQAATRSNDGAAVQTARRLLSLASAALTAERARAPVFARPVEVALSVPTPVAAPASRAPNQLAPTQTALAQTPPPLVTAPAVAAPAVTATAATAVSAPAPKAIGSHIEFAANGEAQLVLGAARAPAPELLASLGDAATLVLSASAPSTTPITTGVEAMPAEMMLAEAAPTEARAPKARKAAQAATLMAGLITIEAPVSVLALADTPEITLIPALFAARQQSDALAAATIDAAPQGAAPSAIQSASLQLSGAAPAIIRQAVARVEAASASASATVDVMAFALAPEALAQSSVAPAPVLTSAVALVGADGAGINRPGDPRANPAWLLHIRRAGPDGRTMPSAPALTLTSADAPGSRLFDSDDADLNQFAARLRGANDPGVDHRSPAARQAAIARLEAVIARVRAA